MGILKLTKYHYCLVSGHDTKPIRGMQKLLSTQKKAMCGWISCWLQLPHPSRVCLLCPRYTCTLLTCLI